MKLGLPHKISDSGSDSRVRSYVSPRTRVSRSQIHGQGMFASQPIRSGEIVCIKGGHILRKSEIYSSGSINSYLPLDDEFYLGARNEDEEPLVKLVINHSCSPNCGMRGEITIVAMRDIQVDEELTIDYAMVDNEDYEFVCNCGTDACRGRVSGFDWRKPHLQRTYGKFFARYLRDKFSDPGH